MWLESLELGQYSTTFEENAIDWELLPELDQETLKDIGVNAAGHRLRILKAASDLTAEPPSIAPGVEATTTLETETTSAPEEDNASWSRTPGERKPVTMLFVDIVGSTRLTEKLDAEEAHELLYRATQLMCMAVEKNKGTVCRFMGDGLMAMFGAPMSSEHHALEASMAALEMQRSINDYAVKVETVHGNRIQIRVGMHSGEVVVLEVGDDPNKPEYDASGPTVPLAARMEQAAIAGTIFITSQTRTLAGNLIETVEQPPVIVKGFSEPIVVYQLQKVLSATESPPDLSKHLFVGRKSELAQFRGVLETCLEDGQGQTVFVRGEAGIGKTRLVGEMTRIAQERRFESHKSLVLDFGAGKGQEAIPSLVRNLLGIVQGSGKRERGLALDKAESEGLTSSGNRVFLNDLLDLEQPFELRTLYEAMDEDARFEGRCRAVSDLMWQLANINPLLLVMEDLHWADSETLDHLANLTSAATKCPALIVLTSRLEGDPLDSSWRTRAGDSPIVTWDLSPLRLDESQLLVATFIGLDNDMAKRCVERAAGNPLFLEQLLLGVNEGSETDIPDSIKSLVLSRMDQMAREDKLALRAASVLGQRFDISGVRHLVSNLNYDCQNLIAHHLIRSEGSLYLFVHALIQESAYASLLKSQRHELHRLAAEWFDGRDSILHAEHLDRADDNAASDAYLKASQEQAGLYRHERALQLVRRGFEISPGEMGFQLSCFEGELLQILGSVKESIEVYQRAKEFAQDDLNRCSALLGIAEGLSITQAHEEMIEVLQEAEKLAQVNKLSLHLSRIYRMLNGMYFFRGETRACLEAGLQSLRFAREAGSPELEARALSAIGDAEYNRGRMVSAYNYFDECIELAQKHGFGRIIAVNLAMRAVGDQWKNNIEMAIRDCGEAIEIAAKTRDYWAEMIALVVGGNALAEMGNFVEGKEWLTRGLNISHRLQSEAMEGMFLYYMGKHEILENNKLEAYDLAKRAIIILRDSEAGMTFHGAGALGVLALATGDLTERHSALKGAEKMLRENAVGHNQLEFYEDAMETCLQIAEWDEVNKYAQALEDFTREEPLPRSEYFIARGRLLAACGRGIRGSTIKTELQGLVEQADQVGLKYTIPAIELALSSI